MKSEQASFGRQFIKDHPIWAGWVPEVMAELQHIRYHNTEVYEEAANHLESGRGLYVNVAPHTRTIDPILPLIALDRHLPSRYRRSYIASIKWEDPEKVKDLNLGLEDFCLPPLERTIGDGIAELRDIDRIFVVQLPLIREMVKARKLSRANIEAIKQYNTENMKQAGCHLQQGNILIALAEGTRNRHNTELQSFQDGTDEFLKVPEVRAMSMWLAGADKVLPAGTGGIKGFKAGQTIDIAVAPLLNHKELCATSAHLAWSHAPDSPIGLNHAMGIHLADFIETQQEIPKGGNWRGFYANEKIIRK